MIKICTESWNQTPSKRNLQNLSDSTILFSLGDYKACKAGEDIKPFYNAFYSLGTQSTKEDSQNAPKECIIWGGEKNSRYITWVKSQLFLCLETNFSTHISSYFSITKHSDMFLKFSYKYRKKYKTVAMRREIQLLNFRQVIQGNTRSTVKTCATRKLWQKQLKFKRYLGKEFYLLKLSLLICNKKVKIHQRKSKYWCVRMVLLVRMRLCCGYLWAMETGEPQITR